LKDDTFRILKELRHVTPNASADRLKAIEKEAIKKSIETARYVIPLGAFTAMVHTISGITLYRLYRMMNASDTPHEARLVIGAMVDAVRQHDPAFFDRVAVQPLDEDEVPEVGFPHPRRNGEAFAAAFDRQLNGRVAQLVDFSPNAEAVIAEAVRGVFGLNVDELGEDEALARLLDPAQNRYRLDTLNVSYHSPLMRTLQHASYAFRKRLSHTADSQDQRHRMVPGSRPLMALVDTHDPDVVLPRLIASNPAARAEYEAAIARAWTAKNRLLALGVPMEFALYVLPNAKVIRFIESGPLIALLHKWTMRTCFNAQEEIYLASMEEVEQVRAIHPRLMRFVGPPCVVRNGLVSPRCTEGTKFCGVPVWRSFPQVERRL
jgi:thymidylate synthase ThyX